MIPAKRLAEIRAKHNGTCPTYTDLEILELVTAYESVINGPAACVAETTAPSISPSQEGVGSADSGAAPIDRAAIEAAIRCITSYAATGELLHKPTCGCARCVVVNAARAYQEAAAELARVIEERDARIEREQLLAQREIEIAMQLREELARVKGERDALVMAVGRKYSGETRYETALRYINEREQGSSEDCRAGDVLAASTPAKGGSHAG